jgi:hypothetical protein
LLRGFNARIHFEISSRVADRNYWRSHGVR